MKKPFDIIIVDDDSEIRSLLVEYLSQQGYHVLSADCGKTYKPLLIKHKVKLVIMDVMMPGENGLSLLAWTNRQQNPPPVLMLTAKGSLNDKVTGLTNGAEDYLVKPFEPRELLARIAVILRRQSNDQINQVYFGKYTYYLQQQRLLRDNKEIKITTGEHQLLQLFSQHQGKVLSREFLTEQIKGYDHDPFDRTIDIRITRLRKKIDTDSGLPSLITTIRAQGYRLEIPIETNNDTL